ncbi:MAG: tetratricopeptide repeat protein [Terriglobales bacterium]
MRRSSIRSELFGLAAFLFIAAIPAICSDTKSSDLEAILQKRYVGRVFTLRGFYAYDDLRYDRDGNPIGKPPVGSWTTSIVAITEMKLSNNKVQLEGPRFALQRDPNNFDPNLYLGAILYKQREMESAKVYLDRAVKLEPKNLMARYQSAMWKSTSGQYEVAAHELEGLIQEDPNWLEPHVELATLYYKLHRPADGARERQIVEKLTAEQQAQGPPK